MISGLLPVGKPSTNGWSSVGWNVWMRPGVELVSFVHIELVEHGFNGGALANDVVGNVRRHRLGVFSDDDTPS